jgi:hypothetical protein
MSKEIKKENNDCFIIMPIADQEGYDKGHFNKVYEDLFKVACDKSGFKAVRADEVKQTNLIHLDILQKLIESPMAICDLSNRNPNVLFELGLRQAFDKPTVLVQECGTPKIFDISPLRYTEYRKELKYREVLEDQESIAEALSATKEATDKGEGINSIVSLLSLSSPASLKDISDNDTAKMMQVIMSEMNDLRTDFRHTLRRFADKEPVTPAIMSNAIEIEFERITRDFTKLKDCCLSKNTPIEIVTDLYDRFQNRTMRLIEQQHQLPIRIRNSVKEMSLEADMLISRYVGNSKK